MKNWIATLCATISYGHGWLAALSDDTDIKFWSYSVTFCFGFAAIILLIEREMKK